MTHTDRCGVDSLVEVLRVPDGFAETVVRWCCKCGAIVGDTDYDGRTKPGDVFSMRFPENATSYKF